MDRSGIGNRHRRTPSNSHRMRITEHHVGPLDSLSNASVMEVCCVEIYVETIENVSDFFSFYLLLE